MKHKLDVKILVKNTMAVSEVVVKDSKTKMVVEVEEEIYYLNLNYPFYDLIQVQVVEKKVLVYLVFV